MKRKDVAVGHFCFAVEGKKNGAEVYHFLDVTELNHPEPTTMVVSFNNKPPVGMAGDQVHAIVEQVLENYDKLFFNLPMAMARRVRADLAPEKPLRQSMVVHRRVEGFSELYRAFCGHVGVQYREDIAWDVENVLHPSGVTVFDAREFEQPIEAKELVALFKTLQFSTQFKELVVTPMTMSRGKIDRDAVVAAAEVFMSNRAISSLTMMDCGPHLSAAIPSLALAMTSNGQNHLTHLILPSNGLDDKDIVALAGGIGAMKHGLVTINLASNDFSKKGCQALVGALQKNARMASTLLHLNLSHSKIGAEGSAALAQWLAVPNVLRELLLNDTQTNVQSIAQSLCRGSRVATVDFGGNKFVKGFSVADITAYFATSNSLTSINLSNTTPSTEQVKDLLRALASNSQIERLEVDLSSNGLGVVGANLLAIELRQLVSLTSLMCGDNGFKDKGLSILCDSLSESDRLTRLDLSDNFDLVAFRKSKATSSLFVEAIGNLVAGDKCVLRELRLASTQKATQMKSELMSFFVDLGSNKTITTLDVSGQGLEYSGFVGLTKTLQLNKTLKKLVIDDNHVDLQCLRSLLQALGRNSTLHQLPLPVNDVAQLLSKADVATRRDFASLWGAIETILHRNHALAATAAVVSSANGSTSLNSSNSNSNRGSNSALPNASLTFSSFSRSSNVQTAAQLFDRAEELDQLRFAVRMGNASKEQSPESRALLSDVDNHHQAAVALAGMRSRTLDKASAQIAADLERVMVPMVAEHTRQTEHELRGLVLETLRKSFPSLAESEPQMAEALDRAAREQKAPDFSGLVLRVAGEVEAHLDGAAQAQMKSATAVVQEALVTGMKAMLAAPTEQNNQQEPVPVLRPLSISKSEPGAVPQSPPQSPRRVGLVSPRSAADVLRKFSDSATGALPTVTPIPTSVASSRTDPTTPPPPPLSLAATDDDTPEKRRTKPGSHSRSKSGSHSTNSKLLKSPRTKKLSLVDPVELPKARRTSGVMLPIGNALVSPEAMEKMLVADEEEVNIIAKAQQARTARRRPRGPSSMFDAHDLALVQEMERAELGPGPIDL